MQRNLTHRIVSILLCIIMVLSNLPHSVLANNKNEIIFDDNGYLFIEQQIKFGSITDINEEQEYIDVYNESDETHLLYKATQYDIGKEVKLSIIAEEGYCITDIRLEKVNDEEKVEYTYDKENGILSFIMPESSVYVSASFEEIFVENNEASDLEEIIDSEVEIQSTQNSVINGEVNTPNIYIRELTTQLFYGAEYEGNGKYIWNADKPDKGHRFSFRINYAISGVDVAPANSITFTVPKTILIDRDGNSSDEYEMSIPTKAEVDAFLNGTGESIDIDVNWGYVEEDDKIIIYNFRELYAGHNGYIELSYLTNKTTFNYVDMFEHNPFTCVMTVPNEQQEATPIVVKINTTAKILSTNKRYPVKYEYWEDAWGNNVKPQNHTQYQYLIWTIESNINATQPYDLSFNDIVVGNYEGMEVLGYKFSGSSQFVSESTVKNQTQNQTRYDYVITSIPLDKYGDKTYWEANNTITVMVEPLDLLDEDTQAVGKNKWIWEKPTFTPPEGDVKVYKYADGAFRANSIKSHKASSLDFTASEYTRYDLETFNGYNNTEISNTILDGFKYASWLVSYSYPWTYDYSYNDQYNHNAYGKLPVKYELIDEGVQLTNGTDNEEEFSEMLTSEDFRFESLGFSWYMADAIFDESIQQFGESTVQYTDTDIISFFGKFGNSEDWIPFATYNLKTKTADFDDTYVKTMTNNNIVFHDDVDLIGYKVTTENAHFYTEIYTVPRLVLKNSEKVMNYVSGKSLIGILNHDYGNFYCLQKPENKKPELSTEITNVNVGDSTISVRIQDANEKLLSGVIFQILDANDPSVVYAECTSKKELQTVHLDSNCSYILHEVFAPTGYVLADDITFVANDGDVLTVTNELSDAEYEYVVFAETEMKDTEYARISKRYSYLDKSVASVSNNIKNKTYTIAWEVSQSEEMEWGNGGEREYIPQNGGRFYDLLPKGSVFNKKSIDVRAGEDFLSSSAYSVTIIDNFKNSGRTMLIIDIPVVADYYKVYYDTVHSWNSLDDYGRDAYNPVAYETGNKSITNGFPDNGGQYFADGEENPNAIKDAKLMSELNPELTGSSARKFIYAESVWDITALTTASSGLMKKVKSENDSNYSYETTTTLNGHYSYQLRYMNSYTSYSKNMIFFDSLENYDYDTMRNYGTLSDWRGTLESIDLRQIKDKGVDPVVYYSTIEKLDIEEHHDISDTSVWTELTDETDLSKVKAIAIDMRKSVDGTDFILKSSESVVVTLHMKAPAVSPKQDGNYAYTYNNVYISDTAYSPTDESSAQDFLIHQDYTAVKLLVAGDFGLTKVSSESDEIKIKDISFRLMGVSDYGTAIDEIVETDINGQIYFKNIEMGNYVLQEYRTTDDWLLDTTEHYVEVDGAGKVWINEEEYTNSYITIKNNPRIHGDFSFYKKELGEDDLGIVDTKFRLSGLSDYGNEIVLYATSMQNGRVVFKNLELGVYKLEEVASNPNYLMNNIVYKVRVDERGTISIISSNEIDENGNPISLEDSEWIHITNDNIAIYNEYKYSEVLLRKVDSINPSIYLEGAIFSLTGISNNGTKVNMTVTSDSNGLVAFNGVEQGTYILKEIQAPTNVDETGKIGGTLSYMLNEMEYIVKIGDRGVVTIDGLVQEENTGYFIFENDRVHDKEIVITKIWDDGLTSEERIALGLIPKLHLTNKDLSLDETFLKAPID